MAQRDQLAGFLRGKNARQARRAQDISFGDFLRLDQLHSGLLETNFSPRHGLAHHYRFMRDIDHVGFAARIEVCKPDHFVSPFFHDLTAVRICSAAFNFGLTCFKLNQGDKPNKSWMTSIWPSQSGPDPIPMVGIVMRCVNSAATVGATSSRTMAKAPASVRA